MNLLPALALATLISDDACSARLDNLLVTYREYGLPLPPPDAVLMRKVDLHEAYLDIDLLSEAVEAEYKRHGWSAVVVKPDPVTLGNEVNYSRLDFAIACHSRGWRSLARAAFRKWLAGDHLRAERQLACDAWEYWRNQLSEGAPLVVVARYLKRAIPHTGFADEGKVALLRSLELSVATSRSAPGSDDALIDELIETPRSWSQDTPAARALTRRGFAAIPALIAHLGDDRLTRSLVHGDFLRVKDVAYHLLCAFAGAELEPSNDIAARTVAAGRWFVDAQKVGEEEYVVSHIGRGKFSTTDDVLLPHLIEKYPMRLPEVFRGLIDDRSRYTQLAEDLAGAIVVAPIPLADKLKVLEYGAAHPVRAHRWVALHHLHRLDPGRANELLIAALDRLPPDASPVQAEFVKLIPEDSDPKVWAALARTAKRVNPHPRILLLCYLDRAKDNPSTRSLRVGFLAAHLIDTDVWASASHILEVRNIAAWLLDGELDLGARSNFDWTATQWAQLRERIRHTLEHDAWR